MNKITYLFMTDKHTLFDIVGTQTGTYNLNIVMEILYYR